jgi:hypothetical protein
MGTRRPIDIVVLAVGLGALAAIGSCGGDGDEVSSAERDAGVYEVVLRNLVLADLPPKADEDPLPVVYVVGADGTTVPVDIQVNVVKPLKDEAEIRFVDARGDAVLDEAPEGDDREEPVRDNGVLVTFGALPETGSTIEVEVDIYSSVGDERAYNVTLAGGPSRWQIRSAAPIA